MYQPRDGISPVPKVGSDGLYHQRIPQGSKKRKWPVKYAEKAFEWASCCEHCPYPDCKIGNNNRVCISEDRWGDFIRFKEIVRRMIISGEECTLICKRFRCTMNTLIAWVDGEKYPGESAQERIWNFLTEKEKENGYVDT
jgi:hypothetical protein